MDRKSLRFAVFVKWTNYRVNPLIFNGKRYRANDELKAILLVRTHCRLFVFFLLAIATMYFAIKNPAFYQSPVYAILAIIGFVVLYMGIDTAFYHFGPEPIEEYLIEIP